jgi:hypothetical protein
MIRKVFPVLTAAVQTQILPFSFFIREVPGDDNEGMHFYVLLIPALKKFRQLLDRYKKISQKREIKRLSCFTGILREREPRSFFILDFFLHRVNEFPDGGDLMYKTEKFFFSNSVVFVRQQVPAGYHSNHPVCEIVFD